MNPNPKMSGFKYAFTGTNCSGKTTMALGVTARLKRQHILAEVVSSQDRKITWKDDYFPFTPIAHYGMITNAIHAETQAMLKGDADVVLTDRSVLDLYAIAVTDHPGHPMILGLENAVLSWMTTYTKVFYLAPLTYQEDGKRPADDFRMRTHATLRDLMSRYNLPNVVEIDRSDAYGTIARDMGFAEPKPIFAEASKWRAIAKALGIPLYIKPQNCAVTSDIDVWALMTPAQAITGSIYANSFNDLTLTYFGPDLSFHFMPIPDSAVTELLAKNDGSIAYHP